MSIPDMRTVDQGDFDVIDAVTKPDTRSRMAKLSVSVDQVDDDIRNELAVKHRRFVVAHRSKNIGEFKAAAEALAQHCAGIASVVSSIAQEISK